MKFLKQLGCAAAVTFAMAGTASAGPVMNNWYFNPAGTGYADSVRVGESLQITGDAFIQLTAGTAPGTFNFRETAVFRIPYSNTSAPFTTGNITATFQASGTGVFDGSFNFTSGTIKMYRSATDEYGSTNGNYGANAGTQIAEFEVLGGGGRVDATGNPILNGQVTVNARAAAGDLEAGYFFRNGGADLSLESLLSFAFTNANTLGAPDQLLVDEVACQFHGFTGPGCGTGNYANAPGQYFFVGNNGQFKLAEVPEPGTLALFGIAMLGAGVVSRKRAKKA